MPSKIRSIDYFWLCLASLKPWRLNNDKFDIMMSVVLITISHVVASPSSDLLVFMYTCVMLILNFFIHWPLCHWEKNQEEMTSKKCADCACLKLFQLASNFSEHVLYIDVVTTNVSTCNIQQYIWIKRCMTCLTVLNQPVWVYQIMLVRDGMVQLLKLRWGRSAHACLLFAY